MRGWRQIVLEWSLALAINSSIRKMLLIFEKPWKIYHTSLHIVYKNTDTIGRQILANKFSRDAENGGKSVAFHWREPDGVFQIVIGVRGTHEAHMGLARLIRDLHPGASAPPIWWQTVPDLSSGARSLSGIIYVRKRNDGIPETAISRGISISNVSLNMCLRTIA